MPDLLPEASSPARDFAVASVRSVIVDVPTMRRHKLSQTSVTAHSYVIVQLRLANGAEGVGEAATLGGPRWSEESVEAMKANIDAYLAPAILDQRADQFEAAGIRMDQAAKRNNAAKAAIETALFDAVGKSLNLPAAALLGGAVRTASPCSGLSRPAIRRRRWRRPSASSRLACIAPSRSRSARRNPRPTWPGCATSPARWRAALS